MQFSDIALSTKLKVVSRSEMHEPHLLGTKTFTDVKREQTDNDPSLFEVGGQALGTETFTKAGGENTDKDFSN